MHLYPEICIVWIFILGDAERTFSASDKRVSCLGNVIHNIVNRPIDRLIGFQKVSLRTMNLAVIQLF